MRVYGVRKFEVLTVVQLTFYGGVNEIGGNKILLEDGNTHIFLDFGKSFTCGCDYFTGWLSPRRIKGLGDYFHFGLLPKISGIYAEDQLKFTNLPYTEPLIDAIFLSHAHFDHIAHIEFVDPKIPIYLGEGTKLFMESQEETSTFSDYGEHPYKTFRTGDEIQIGNIAIEPIHVDHSIPAAYGFLIHTSEGTLMYTGDLRLHGPRRDMTEEFIERTCESDPIAMICEGTRMVEVERRKNYSEQQVRQLSNEVVSSTDKMVFFSHYSRDMDRFRSLYSVAKRNGRKIVISTKTAHLLSKLVDDVRLDLPDPVKDDNILVYFKRKKSGDFEEKDYYRWERPFLDKMVTFEHVHENQSEYVMDLGFYQFAELVDIKPDSGSHFIHSMSEPFSDEDIEDEVMHNWLKLFGLQFHQLHASGHMNRRQLGNLIRKVNPKKVFPVHTEHPQLFTSLDYETQIVECGSGYNIN
jgi:ribonuclease J